MSRLHIVIYTLSLVLFGLLCFLARQFSYLPGDIATSLWIQGTIPPSLYSLMQAISYVNSLIPAFIIVTILVAGLWASGKRLEPVFIATLTISAALINWLLKLLISRPRPSSELIQILDNSDGLSFPSGHVTYALAFFGFLFYLIPQLIKTPAIARTLQSILILIIIITGISRIYLGAHWPSDVLGSLFLGGLMLTPAVVLYHNYVKATKDKSGGESARAT